jgi:hypothetical protein
LFHQNTISRQPALGASSVLLPLEITVREIFSKKLFLERTQDPGRESTFISSTGCTNVIATAVFQQFDFRGITGYGVTVYRSIRKLIARMSRSHRRRK